MAAVPQAGDPAPTEEPMKSRLLLAALLALSCRTRTPAPVNEAPAFGADALAALDDRAPVPLEPMMAWHQKQQMQDHLKAVQRIVDGAARGDWEAVAAAGAQIGSSPEMQQTCERMGAGAPGFTELALEFHRRADAIGEAAKTHDTAAVLRATSYALQACTECHGKYRQDVVDAQGFQDRTGLAPMSMEPGSR
jgi:hypothetical protein